MSWDLFISYASEDRKAFAKPLASALQARKLNVWFDEFELKPGDSIRGSIDRGLAETKVGVVLLSKSFFQKNWTQLELSGLFAARSARGCRIVPVWLDVDSTYIATHSPMLADIKAIPSQVGVAQAAREIESLVRNPYHGLPPPPPGVNDCICVQANKTVHGIDETYVQYTRLLLRDGKNPDLLVNIHLQALKQAFLIPIPVYQAINDTFDFHKTLKRFNTNRSLGRQERALYLSMREIERKIEQLEREIRQGLLDLLTRDAIMNWVTSDQDVVLSMCAYIRRFFSTSSGPCHLDLLIMGKPRWKIHINLKDNEAIELYRRAQNSLNGDYPDWHHEQLVGRLIPEILFRTIHNRERDDPEPIPDYVFDLTNWQWFASAADPGWRRLIQR